MAGYLVVMGICVISLFDYYLPNFRAKKERRKYEQRNSKVNDASRRNLGNLGKPDSQRDIGKCMNVSIHQTSQARIASVAEPLLK